MGMAHRRSDPPEPGTTIGGGGTLTQDHLVTQGNALEAGETQSLDVPLRRRRTRMSDVAERAGVSTTTVSIVLSGKAGSSIPDVTKERVFEASRELGYRANAMARNLRRQRSETIGLISDTIASTPYAGLMVRGADQVAAAAGMTLMIVNTERDPEVEARAIDLMLGRQVDAIIYATMWHQLVEPPAALDEVPCVFLDARTDRPGDAWVVPDEEGGGYAATAHLIERGHTRIGYIHEANEYPAHPERLAGYRRALDEHGLDFRPELVAEDRNDPFGGTNAAARLLELREPPTAIQCYTDRMAMGAYRAIRHGGLRVPDDISVIGFDNQDQIAPWLDPPLTTMQLPHEAMGRWAVEYLVRVLSGEAVGPHQERLECPLVVRDSVAPPRYGAGVLPRPTRGTP
jgi:LacI family transcriptional regulator, galactose operon repressor